MPAKRDTILFMNKNSKLMDMLTGYAAAHQHPMNIAVHMVGIPTIMLGVFIPLSWASFEIGPFIINFAFIAAIILFLFYVTLDTIFAFVFLLCAWPIAMLGTWLGAQPHSGIIAAVLFFGGYLAQFIGHAVEKSVPVILKHPIQANLAAPFFTVVELFKIFGWREALFNEVQDSIAAMRQQNP